MTEVDTGKQGQYILTVYRDSGDGKLLFRTHLKGEIMMVSDDYVAGQAS